VHELIQNLSKETQMLNASVAEEARRNLKAAVENLTEASERSMALSLELYELRRESSHQLIPKVESFINSLAATPKEFDKTFKEYRVEVESFDTLVHEVEAQQHEAEVKGGTAAGVGTAAGLATAFAAPAGAIALATTFGTASTGAAISTLSGAAATNAALAWLGGGALAAGGSGIAGGTGLLALAGPVGLGLAALCIAGGAVYVRTKNNSIADEANEQRKAIEARRHATEAVAADISSLRDLTKMQVAGMRSLLATVMDNAQKDYRMFDKSRKEMLAALVNHVHILSSLLNKRIAAGDC
jgi:hypothetical protein